MNTKVQYSPEEARPVDRCKGTARLIATYGGSRILRHRDGSLDVCSSSPREREAALAWICAVSPDLAQRVRRCPESPV